MHCNAPDDRKDDLQVEKTRKVGKTGTVMYKFG